LFSQIKKKIQSFRDTVYLISQVLFLPIMGFNRGIGVYEKMVTIGVPFSQLECAGFLQGNAPHLKKRVNVLV
jgi:hypothetical protein